MLKRAELEAEEERLRQAVAALPGDKRRAFYRDAREALRDPDTYAALNWFFMVGLHHFYLGNWRRGIADIAGVIVGVMLLFSDVWPLGVAALVAVAGAELWALTRAQLVVQDWNNRLYRKLLRRHGGYAPGKDPATSA